MIDFEIDDTLDFTTTAESTASIRLPKRDWTGMVLSVTYTVTDSGISAGENIAGAISRLLMQAPGFVDEEPLDIRRNEIADVIELLNPLETPGTIMYYDAQPTTGQSQETWFYLPWAYAGSKYTDNAVLNLTMNFGAEFGGASAVNCSVRVGLVSGSSSGTSVVKRNSRAATTGDDVPAPTLPYSAVLIKTATAGDLSYINVPSGPMIRNPAVVNHNWTIYTDAASTENSEYYFLVTSKVARTDALRVEGATSEARDVWYVCPVSA